MFIFRQPEMMDISQTLPTSSIIYALDMVGVAACTAAATMLAKRLQFDIFGAFFCVIFGECGRWDVTRFAVEPPPYFLATRFELSVFYHGFIYNYSDFLSFFG